MIEYGESKEIWCRNERRVSISNWGDKIKLHIYGYNNQRNHIVIYLHDLKEVVSAVEKLIPRDTLQGRK